jgi:hypothetical protein
VRQITSSLFQSPRSEHKEPHRRLAKFSSFSVATGGSNNSSFRICDNQLMCDSYRLTHSKQYLAERLKATGEIEERPRCNIAAIRAC